MNIVKPKPWYKSRAMIASAVTGILAVLTAVGVDWQQVTTEGELVTAGTAVATLIAAVMGWIGRRDATQPVKGGKGDLVGMIVLSVFTFGVLGGCANTTHGTLTDESNASEFREVDQGRYRVDDNGAPAMDLLTHSGPPTMTQADADGFWNATTGEGAVINLPNFGQVWTPNDTTMTNVEIFDPEGRPVFSADKLDVNVSNQAAIWAAQVGVITRAAENMTEIEYKRYVESLEAAARSRQRLLSRRSIRLRLM